MALSQSGFNGAIWAVALASIEYLTSVLKTTKNFVTAEPVIDATLKTLLNGVDTINMFNYSNSWQVERNNFAEILGLPLAFSAAGQFIAANRYNTYNKAIDALQFNFTVPNLQQAVANLKFGIPAIGDTHLLDFCFNFNEEPCPPGLTPDNFQPSIQLMADAFASLAQSIAQSQGKNLTKAYDAAVRQFNLTQIQANLIASFTSGGIANREIGVGDGKDIHYIWNQLAVLPTLLKGAELIGNAPYLETAQQALLQKFVLLTMAQNLSILLMSIQQPLIQNIKTARIANGQSLMDLAADKLQNFEDWQDIAQTNNLKPPWIVQASNDPSIAQWGQQLILPGSQSGIIGKVPSYLNNFLGVDIYFGALEQDMPNWTGDFQTISGYQNLQISLRRRLLTAIGSLIYHSKFGSEIPRMIGTISTQGEAPLITALAKSALLSDPRVAQVINDSTRILQEFSFGYTGTVIPNGLTAQTIQINEVLT